MNEWDWHFMLDKSMAEAKTGGFTLEKDVGKIK